MNKHSTTNFHGMTTHTLNQTYPYKITSTPTTTPTSTTPVATTTTPVATTTTPVATTTTPVATTTTTTTTPVAVTTTATTTTPTTTSTTTHKKTYLNSTNYNSTALPNVYVKCADDNSQCNFTGTKSVAYTSLNNKTFYKTLSDGTLCSSAIFGDPDSSSTKSCYIASVPVPTFTDNVPDGYALCSKENTTCSPGGLYNNTTNVYDLLYTANGAYSYAAVNSPISCTSDTLGDPSSGSTKNCYWQLNGNTATATSTTSTTPTSTSTTPTSTTPTTTSTSTSTTPSTTSTTISKNAIIAIVCGVVIFVICIIALIIFFIKTKKNN